MYLLIAKGQLLDMAENWSEVEEKVLTWSWVTPVTVIEVSREEVGTWINGKRSE